jgi:hypothetical protein
MGLFVLMGGASFAAIWHQPKEVARPGKATQISVGLQEVLHRQKVDPDNAMPKPSTIRDSPKLS